MMYYRGAMDGQLNISELAEAANLSRRAIRFYVQRGLLPKPLGLGRGRHYDWTHLQRLQRIAKLQAAGHSLEAIRRILETGAEEPPTEDWRPPRFRPRVASELWVRLPVSAGIELHYDATAYRPDPQALSQLRQTIRKVFGVDWDSNGSHDDPVVE